MSVQPDLDMLKEIPGYKAILKSVLKSQIQLLLEQLSDHTGEESVILTASINDGSLSHLGSSTGKGFLEGRDEIKSQFLGYCLKSHHRQKTQETNASPYPRSRTLMPQHARRPRIRPMPYSVSTSTTTPSVSSASLFARASSQEATNFSQVDNITPKSEQDSADQFIDEVTGASENSFSSDMPSSVHLSHTQTGGTNNSFTSNASQPESTDSQSESFVKKEADSGGEDDLEVTGIEIGDNSLSSENWGSGFGIKISDNQGGGGEQASFSGGPETDQSPYEGFYTTSSTEKGGVMYRLYICTFCGKETRRKSDIERHVLKHTKEKPFKCELCGRGFTRNQILVGHMFRQHPSHMSKTSCDN